jgi:hypothetical protein
MAAKKPKTPKTYKVDQTDYIRAKKRCDRSGATLSNVLERVVKAIARDKSVLWIEDKRTVVEIIDGDTSIRDVRLLS